jgi:hypothetical protein
VVLVADLVNAHSLLKPFASFVAAESHGHGTDIPPEFLAHLKADWLAGHSAITQAATIYTSGQLIGVLLACLLGIVLITGEYHHQTATTTFVLAPRRTVVVAGKLVRAVVVAAASWLVSTVISLVAGIAFLSSEGYGSQLDHWSVVPAVGRRARADRLRRGRRGGRDADHPPPRHRLIHEFRLPWKPKGERCPRPTVPAPGCAPRTPTGTPS